MRATARYAIAGAAIAVLVLVELFSALKIGSKATVIDVSSQHEPTAKPSQIHRANNGGKNINPKFHGLDLRYVSEAQPSTVHCVGDNFLPRTSSGYRSCEFRHLCWDFKEKEFVIFESDQQKHLSELMEQMPSRYARSSSNFNTSVSISPTSEGKLRTGKDGQWFPRSVPMDDQGFYELPEDVVLVPVEFPMDGNIAQTEIVFDYYHPVFNLLKMFHLHKKSVLFMNLGPECPISQECYSEALRFLPVMKKSDNAKDTFAMSKHSIQWASGNNMNQDLRSSRICARYAASGIGGLTDHGIHKKSHGERRKDYTFVQNSGRGPMFMDFRKYVLNNFGILPDTPVSTAHSFPTKLVVCTSSSKLSGTQDFQKQVSAIQNHFLKDKLMVQQVAMSDLPIQERFQMASEASFYMSEMGDGALPAFVLPRGATLILFYNDNSEFVSVTKNEVSFPVKLDWDLWNNLSHLRVHWLPLSTINEESDINILLEIIHTQMEGLEWEAIASTARAQTSDPDGTFNGMDVFYASHPQYSAAHCIGDNFQDRAHALRSCSFQYMCLDLSSKANTFSISASKKQAHLMNSMGQWKSNSFALSSTTMNNSTVSVGHNIRFEEDSEWFPKVRMEPLESFYELSPDVVWIPFHADQPNIHNPGHLLWDYFLPFFNLLVMFGLENHKLLISNIDGACVQDEDTPCWKMVTKFLPLLGIDPNTFRNTLNARLETNGERRSDLVCARHGVAGIGMLTDHGYNRHGQRFEDYRDVHNVGRGPLFYAFRNFVVQNMGIEETRSLQRPYPITFSINSSKNPARRLAFQEHVDTLRNSFGKNEISVQQVTLADLSVQEQIRVATESAIFVSVVGGAASTATFLPPGSSVILFFNDIDDFVDHSPRDDFPCMIDWDFWNNASYLRVHWLPMSTMNDAHDLKVFLELVRSEIATLGIMNWAS